jgi:hypothetical protein
LIGDVLVSPFQKTPWHEVTLRAEQWSDSAAVRGVAGIHARRLPRDWRRADPRATEIGHCEGPRNSRAVRALRSWQRRLAR